MSSSPISVADAEQLLGLLAEAFTYQSVSEFRGGVIELLGRVVPYDSAGYNEIAPNGTFAVTIPQLDFRLLPAFTELAHENPVMAHYQRTLDGRPYRISDMIDRSALHALQLYQRVYRHIGVEYQVGFAVPAAAPLIIAIVLCRSGEDFTDREVQLLGLARPHLIQAYRHAEACGTREALLIALQDGLDTVGRPVVVLDRDGRTEVATDAARRLLGDQALARLPADVKRWIRERDRRPDSPLILTGASGRVLIHALPVRQEDRRQVLVVEGDTGALTATALTGLGLTIREAQTLCHLALGLSPNDTARRMRIARRTVDKHLQNTYAKLGASSLDHAVITAWAAVGISPPARSAVP
jgi:DNA-binding CsgD family transcriptional regulator